MESFADLKPKYRSKIRLKAGKAVYTFLRYLHWRRHKPFAKKINLNLLPVSFFKHKTILLRKLKDVDMQYQYNKIINLKIAAQKLNNVVINPGETFSYWKLIGKPTYKKGYIDGMILSSGKVTSGVGGGLCQLSNLIFWMALHTPLIVIERHRHGFDVFPDSDRTQPFGSGATCLYPYQDLMIYNPTGYKFQLCVNVEEEYLTGEWRSETKPKCKYKIIEKNHFIRPEYWGGYSRHNKLYRQVFDKSNNLIDEEFMIENHAIMVYSPLICAPKSFV